MCYLCLYYIAYASFIFGIPKRAYLLYNWIYTRWSCVQVCVVCTYMCICVHPCIHVWKIEVNWGSSSVAHHIAFSSSEFLTEPGACCSSELGDEALTVSSFSRTTLTGMCWCAWILCGAEHPNLGPLAYTATTLLNNHLFTPILGAWGNIIRFKCVLNFNVSLPTKEISFWG